MIIENTTTQNYFIVDKNTGELIRFPIAEGQGGILHQINAWYDEHCKNKVVE